MYVTYGVCFQVMSGPRRSIGFHGIRVIVQSEKDTAFLESRVDAFWEEYKKTLEDMSDEAFEEFKTTVVNRKLEDHKNMWQECVSGFSGIRVAVC
jgi:insulysin